jgi:uncharacterized protein
MERSEKFWNPYLAGVALGLVLLTTLVLMGKGLGASGAANRFGVSAINVVAPFHVDSKPYMASLKAEGRGMLDNWLVFEVLGVFLGGAFGAFSAGRMGRKVIRGPNVTVPHRLIMALSGGIIMGIAARMARGCTSGQALSGGALLSVGSFVFMFAVFGGAYAVAYFLRKEWN